MSSALIVDDHPVVVAAVTLVLASEGFQSIREAPDGVEALQKIRDLQPDVVVLDLLIPKLSGLDLLSRLQQEQLPCQTIVFTSQDAVNYVDRCMRAGALGFVSKTNDLQELRKAVQALKSGYTYFPRPTVSQVKPGDLQFSETQMIKNLSNRELITLQYLARGCSNKEIAEVMLLSHKTISTYKTRLIEKLNVKSLVHLREFAKRNHLI